MVMNEDLPQLRRQAIFQVAAMMPIFHMCILCLTTVETWISKGLVLHLCSKTEIEIKHWHSQMSDVSTVEPCTRACNAYLITFCILADQDQLGMWSYLIREKVPFPGKTSPFEWKYSLFNACFGINNTDKLLCGELKSYIIRLAYGEISWSSCNTNEKWVAPKLGIGNRCRSVMGV